MFRTPLVGACLAAACSVPPVAHAPAAETPALVSPASDPGSPKAPFVLELQGPTQDPDGLAVVTVTIARSAPPASPVELHVSAPVGLRLVQGLADETLEEGGPAITRTFRFAVEDPASTLEVTAAFAGEGMGAFARREVRFDGAAEPVRRPVRPGGPVVPAGRR